MGKEDSSEILILGVDNFDRLLELGGGVGGFFRWCFSLLYKCVIIFFVILCVLNFIFFGFGYLVFLIFFIFL